MLVTSPDLNTIAFFRQSGKTPLSNEFLMILVNIGARLVITILKNFVGIVSHPQYEFLRPMVKLPISPSVTGKRNIEPGKSLCGKLTGSRLE